MAGEQFNPRVARLFWLRAHASDPGFKLVARLVGEGQTVVDIGADLGLYSSRLAELVGPRGCVHAFEPNRARHEVLAALAHAQPHVQVHPCALSDHEGEAELYVPVKDGEAVPAFGRLSPPPDDGDMEWERQAVKLTTLDRALGGDRSRVSLVKCDVEGHELAVLRGGERTLREAMPVLLIEVEVRHSEEDIQTTFDQLMGLGYIGWAVATDGPRPLEQFDFERDQTDLVSGLDLETPPPGYVNNFVFAGRSSRLARELGSR